MVAVLGFVLLFVIEIAAIAVMSMFMLVLGAPAVAVLLLFIGLWLGIAGVYRRLMPAPLIVGRISNKWLQGLEQFAREFSTPNEALVLRSFAPMLGGLIAWVVGYTIVESTPLISRLEAVLAVGLLCGVIGATYYTGRTIAADTETTMSVIAIRRPEEGWLLVGDANAEIRRGDVLIAKGTRTAATAFADLSEA